MTGSATTGSATTGTATTGTATTGPATTGSTTTGSATFRVAGMTCDHCAHAVTGELARLDGVSDIRIEIVVAGESLVTVTADRPLDRQAVAAALAEAGEYQLAGA
jgi:copper chaperone